MQSNDGAWFHGAHQHPEAVTKEVDDKEMGDKWSMAERRHECALGQWQCPGLRVRQKLVEPRFGVQNLPLYLCQPHKKRIFVLFVLQQKRIRLKPNLPPELAAPGSKSSPAQ